jgi:SMI1/KNR4 family protein SUKH-1
MTSVQTSLQRIEAWLYAHAPTLWEQLPPGASDEDLARVEAVMDGITLPEDFKAAYRRHDGWGTPLIFLGRLTLYPLADVIGTLSKPFPYLHLNHCSFSPQPGSCSSRRMMWAAPAPYGIGCG